jgi:hypothetical protein
MYSSYDVNESEVDDDIDPAPFHAISASSSRLLVSSCAVFPSPCLVDVVVCIRSRLLHAARSPTCHSCAYMSSSQSTATMEDTWYVPTNNRFPRLMLAYHQRHGRAPGDVDVPPDPPPSSPLDHDAYHTRGVPPPARSCTPRGSCT